MPMFVSIAAHFFYILTRSDFAAIFAIFVFVCIAKKETENGKQGTGSVENRQFLQVIGCVREY